MKVGRRKNAKKILLWYRVHFDLKEPLPVLIDGTFLAAALKHKIHVKDQVTTLLVGRDATKESDAPVEYKKGSKKKDAERKKPCQSLITSCVYHELVSIAHLNAGPLVIARNLERYNCGCSKENHGRNMPAAKCIEKLCKGMGFLVATNDEKLQNTIRRECLGTPLLRIEGNVMMLEGPSRETERLVEQMEKAKLLADLPSKTSEKSKNGEENGGKKRGRDDDEDSQEEKPKKKRKKKEPNPLSCKKKKPKNDANSKNGAKSKNDAKNTTNAKSEKSPKNEKKLNEKNRGKKSGSQIEKGKENNNSAVSTEKKKHRHKQ